ncbi:MAG: hypothetical protein RI949_2407 [Pseudomonadota bacterium]|jgi:hypothetical protein
MNPTTFTLGLRSLAASLPYGKRLEDDEAKFLWLTLPQTVKETVTDEMWAYAIAQRRMDPAPDKELSIEMQLLRYLYRVRDGMPAFDWGLKLDLPRRMAQGSVFHGSVPPQGDAPQLAAVGSNPMLEGLL